MKSITCGVLLLSIGLFCSFKVYTEISGLGSEVDAKIEKAGTKHEKYLVKEKFLRTNSSQRLILVEKPEDLKPEDLGENEFTKVHTTIDVRSKEKTSNFYIVSPK